MDETNRKDFESCEDAGRALPSDEGLSEIARAIGRMHQLEPPASLLPGVMSAVRAKKLPWTIRLSRWARSRKTITFTPLQAGGFALAMLFGISLFAVQFFKTQQSALLQPGTGHIPVEFSIDLADASSVAVIGSFNQWRPQGFEMQSEKNNRGVWTLKLSLPEGRYEYAFLVDGKKVIPDPRAGFYQDDGFGNQNAVLILGTDHGKAI